MRRLRSGGDMKKHLFVLAAPLALAACAGEPIWAPDEAINTYSYVHDGPPTLTLMTVINNHSGSSGHTGLMINASERVIWDPAGTFELTQAPERNDVHYGITPELFAVYVDYHSRDAWHTVIQQIEVTPEVAELALREVEAYGAVPKSYCSNSTSEILGRLPGFEGFPRHLFPKQTMKSFAQLPNVSTETVYEYDDEDSKVLVQLATN